MAEGLKTKCLAGIVDLPGLVKELRETFTVGPFGTSREETNKTLSDFMDNLVSTVNQQISALAKQYGVNMSDISISDIKDPVLRVAKSPLTPWYNTPVQLISEYIYGKYQRYSAARLRYQRKYA